MEIYPALDILDGKCVRLQKGDFLQKTVYSQDPHSVVRWIESFGARNLHLVDLSGAKDPGQRQISLVQQLITHTNLKIQCGGGIRTFDDIRNLLEINLDRIVLGSLAVDNPSLTLQFVKEFGPNRITLALDVFIDSKGRYKIAINGWKKVSEKNLFDWIDDYHATGLTRILVTDITRDGMLSGPNFQLYQDLVKRFPSLEFQASGGISCLEDLKLLKDSGVHSAIIGKSFYEAKVSLQEALLLC